MKLVEFIAYWPGDYSKEQIATYQVLHGDDRTTWPATDMYSKIIIDLETVIRFNPAMNEQTTTTVDLCCGNAITINLSYESFKDVLRYHGVHIYNSKDAISYINKSV